jgi:hypothetical protein
MAIWLALAGALVAASTAAAPLMSFSERVRIALILLVVYTALASIRRRLIVGRTSPAPPVRPLSAARG